MRRMLPGIVIFVLLAIFYAPLCNVLFSCGCTFLWSGADKHCSIHDSSRPDCPWCAAPHSHHRFPYQMIPFTALCASGFGAIWIIRKKKGANILRELLAGSAAVLIAMLLLGKLYAVVLKYPHFLF